jgi:prepilin-type N-terminal cleavage/methylation domain-containing protein
MLSRFDLGHYLHNIYVFHVPMKTTTERGCARAVAGFTLLEILLVVAAIGILAGIVILALNPSKQLGDTRNAQRRSDVTTILNALYQYSIDNNGNFPSALDSVVGSSQVLGTAVSGCNSVCTATTTIAACADFTSALVPSFVVGIPTDPTTGTAAITDYYINKDNTGRLTVGSCDPESGATIQVTR